MTDDRKRRVRAKPEALAARGRVTCAACPSSCVGECQRKLAQGTAPGNEPSPYAGIERSVYPRSLQHTPQRPLSVEVLEQGIAAALASGTGAPDGGAEARAVMVAAETQLRSVVNGLKVGRAEHDLEVRTAERDRALDVLAALERILRSVGGYMAHADQVWLREARALLVEHGRREPEQMTTWTDRR